MKRSLACLLLSALCCASEPVKICTDDTWLGSDTAGDDWASPQLDDSKWQLAHEPSRPPDNEGSHFSVANQFAFETDSGWIWGGDDDKTVLRRHFNVPPGTRRVEMVMSVDDLPELRLNGEVVEKYDALSSWGHSGCAVLVDLGPWIVNGPNVLAVSVVNRKGPGGFAAEIRIDGESFVPGVRLGEEPSAAIEKILAELTVHLDAEEPDSREAATEAMKAIARRHPGQMGPVIERLQKGASAEVIARLKVVLAESVPSPESLIPGDGQFDFEEMTAAELKGCLESEEDEVVTVIRNHVATSLLEIRNPGEAHRVLRLLLADGTERQVERSVRFISALRSRELIPELLEVLKARPLTMAGAFAASALAGLKVEGVEEALTKAAKCGFAPTERAAKRGLGK